MQEADLTEITIVVVAALLGGLGMSWLRQPPILGYILAGILLGPSSLGFVQSRESVEILAELGVLLLLFVVGMELSLRTFKRVWLKGTLCALMQIIVCIGIAYALSVFFNWSIGLCILLGFVTALSSTAVAVNMLSSIKETDSETSQITIGVLIAQDFAIVPMIIILRGYQEASWLSIGVFVKIILAISLIVALINYLSQRQKVRIPFILSIINNKELIPLVSLTFCFAAAALSGLIGLSAAYGAFLAGIILGNTHESRSILETTKPIQSILMMVFFLSIGLLLDLQFIWKNLWTVISLILLVTFGKTAVNIGIMKLLKIPLSQAFLAGVLLAQIGEFAFLMTSVGFESSIINSFGQKLIISLTALSLAFSPLWMAMAKKLNEMADNKTLNLRSIFGILYGSKWKSIRKMLEKLRNGKIQKFIEPPKNKDFD